MRFCTARIWPSVAEVFITTIMLIQDIAGRDRALGGTPVGADAMLLRRSRYVKSPRRPASIRKGGWRQRTRWAVQSRVRRGDAHMSDREKAQAAFHSVPVGTDVGSVQYELTEEVVRRHLEATHQTPYPPEGGGRFAPGSI